MILTTRRLLLSLLLTTTTATGFQISSKSCLVVRRSSNEEATRCQSMKRPLLDQLATALFRLETNRVSESSKVDDRGRIGEPMEWSESTSLANKVSELMATRAYGFKQWVADSVAGDYDEDQVQQRIVSTITANDIVMYSFTTCPFCRRAKDELDQLGESYTVVELDEECEGNELRSMLGKITRRTSVPCIFIRGECIGGCNDGPGLLPLLESGEFDRLMGRVSRDV